VVSEDLAAAAAAEIAAVEAEDISVEHQGKT
jgi:hypothetical protein